MAATIAAGRRQHAPETTALVKEAAARVNRESSDLPLPATPDTALGWMYLSTSACSRQSGLSPDSGRPGNTLPIDCQRSLALL